MTKALALNSTVLPPGANGTTNLIIRLVCACAATPNSADSAIVTTVIAGLDPAIHLHPKMDPRVKPAGDGQRGWINFMGNTLSEAIARCRRGASRGHGRRRRRSLLL